MNEHRSEARSRSGVKRGDEREEQSERNERRGLTPSQTIGPYFSIGLSWSDGVYAADPGTVGAFWLRGRLFDGADEVIPDGLIESWQADPDGRFSSPEDPRGSVTYPGFGGYARCPTAADGGFAIHTLKPGPIPDGSGGWEAPHIDLSVFARGMLDRVITRVYFDDEATANAVDPALLSVPADRRPSLMALTAHDGYQFDVHLQGQYETLFFTL